MTADVIPLRSAFHPVRVELWSGTITSTPALVVRGVGFIRFRGP